MQHPVNWHIGCSGFHYKHWRGTFYPEGLPQKRWFDFYADQFRTLELNVTFYRFPQVSFLTNWYTQSPVDFRFSVKAPRAITHFKQFHGTVDMISSFYTTIRESLRDKLGPVLFQLPPRLAFTEERLDRILSQLDTGLTNVLEFRHPSWWQTNVYERLAEQGVIFCGMSYPGLPDQLIPNTGIIYYRFHGVPDLYRSAYSEAALSKFAGQVNTDARIRESWCYFNNDAAVAAIPDARALMRFSNT